MVEILVPEIKVGAKAFSFGRYKDVVLQHFEAFQASIFYHCESCKSVALNTLRTIHVVPM
eukprot:COSAG02_NODE_3249_length_7096_cov_5.491496_6_plen_60_part_00